MDSSADTAAWVAAIAAVASLGIVLWQVFGARIARIRQHDIDALKQMLAIITDPIVGANTPWNPTLFIALWVTLSDRSKTDTPTLLNMNANEGNDLKSSLVAASGDIATDLYSAIRIRVGLDKAPPMPKKRRIR